MGGYSLKFRPYIKLIYGIGTSNESEPDMASTFWGYDPSRFGTMFSQLSLRISRQVDSRGDFGSSEFDG